MRWSVVNSLYAKAAVMVFSGTGIWFFAASKETLVWNKLRVLE
jgi:hypothetical protein